MRWRHDLRVGESGAGRDAPSIARSASQLGPRNGVAALDMVNAAIHVTTGADTLNFQSGVDFFEKDVLLSRTAPLLCPLDPDKVQSSSWFSLAQKSRGL